MLPLSPGMDSFGTRTLGADWSADSGGAKGFLFPRNNLTSSLHRADFYEISNLESLLSGAHQLLATECCPVRHFRLVPAAGGA